MSKDIFVHDAGKGSRQRHTDKQKFDEGWDRIFGDRKKTEKESKPFHWVLGTVYESEEEKK